MAHAMKYCDSFVGSFLTLWLGDSSVEEIRHLPVYLLCANERGASIKSVHQSSYLYIGKHNLKCEEIYNGKTFVLCNQLAASVNRANLQKGYLHKQKRSSNKINHASTLAIEHKHREWCWKFHRTKWFDKQGSGVSRDMNIRNEYAHLPRSYSAYLSW